MQTINHQPIIGKTKITCRKCKADLTENDCFVGFYSCPTCDMWTINVDKRFVAGSPGSIDFNCTS